MSVVGSTLYRCLQFATVPGSIFYKQPASCIVFPFLVLARPIYWRPCDGMLRLQLFCSTSLYIAILCTVRTAVSIAHGYGKSSLSVKQTILYCFSYQLSDDSTLPLEIQYIVRTVHSLIAILSFLFTPSQIPSNLHLSPPLPSHFQFHVTVNLPPHLYIKAKIALLQGSQIVYCTDKNIYVFNSR